MPTYDYQCHACANRFTLLRPMVQSASAADCPSCGSHAPRCIAAPRLALMSAGARQAHQTNERSAHAPRIGQRHGHQCGAGCNHDGAQKPALKAASGAKRPWMIGH